MTPYNLGTVFAPTLMRPRYGIIKQGYIFYDFIFNIILILCIAIPDSATL